MPYGKRASRQRPYDAVSVTAYNFAKHLKALQWRAPYQVICEAWTQEPHRFRVSPDHLT
jgi:hypothetical protein